uniref:Uncharacterized protein n=1 Tax=Daphnia galeata TaxID=27404 RepID=A0A8J2RS96_9CRUS|nr:unnamed protein product [Daphnia galeata]
MLDIVLFQLTLMLHFLLSLSGSQLTSMQHLGKFLTSSPGLQETSCDVPGWYSSLHNQNCMAVYNIAKGINFGAENKEITATCAACKILTREHHGINSGAENKKSLQPRAAWKILSRKHNPSMGILINAVQITKDRRVPLLCHQTKAVVSVGAVAGFISLLGLPHPVMVKKTLLPTRYGGHIMF